MSAGGSSVGGGGSRVASSQHPAGPQGTLSVKGTKNWVWRKKGEGPVAPQCPQAWQDWVRGCPWGSQPPAEHPAWDTHPKGGRRDPKGQGGGWGTHGGCVPTTLNGWERQKGQLWGYPLGSHRTHSVSPAARRGKSWKQSLVPCGWGQRPWVCQSPPPCALHPLPRDV